MFQIKICGVTCMDDVSALIECGVDAVGLNFYAKSLRYCPPGRAKEIAAALPDDILRVGLFVNAEIATIRQVYDYVGLDLVQLHGDESPAYLAELSAFPVMKAFRLGPAGLEPVERYLKHCQQLHSLPRLVLLDACVDGQFGGTGRTADWDTAARYASDAHHPPLVLAGGLTPENVAEAVTTVRPQAVDTSSGVESSPGRKEAALVARFYAEARTALEQSRTKN